MDQPNEPGGAQPLEGEDRLPGAKSVREAERKGTAPKPSEDLPAAGPHARTRQSRRASDAARAA